jgi:hypothetical protein
VIVRNDHGLDVRIHRLGIGREHIPRLEKPAPPQVGKHNFLYIPDYRNVPGAGPARNRDQVKEDENADRTLPTARVTCIPTLRSLPGNRFPRACGVRVASSVLPITLTRICAVSGLDHNIPNDEEKALSAHTIHAHLCGRIPQKGAPGCSASLRLWPWYAASAHHGRRILAGKFRADLRILLPNAGPERRGYVREEQNNST